MSKNIDCFYQAAHRSASDGDYSVCTKHTNLIYLQLTDYISQDVKMIPTRNFNVQTP